MSRTFVKSISIAWGRFSTPIIRWGFKTRSNALATVKWILSDLIEEKYENKWKKKKGREREKKRERGREKNKIRIKVRKKEYRERDRKWEKY